MPSTWKGFMLCDVMIFDPEPFSAGSRYCPVTGELLSGWAVLQSNDNLRELVEQWAAKQGVSKEALDKAGSLVHRLASTSF